MKKFCYCKVIFWGFLFLSFHANAQTFNAVSRCGGFTSLDLPDFIDNDLDGLSDTLEQVLMHAYSPKFVQFADDDCPGPSTGTSNPGDSNLVVCHIFPLFQQYVEGNNEPVLYSTPPAIVNESCLETGLSWFENTVLIYSALLYGRDCGLTGHTADVEGVAVSVRYTGPNDGISWRSDLDLSHWEGGKIQTTSHAGTICEGIETFPYRSATNPTGKDTIYPSPDKHGNYLTRDQCSSSFICDPACDDPYALKNVKLVNVGEENNPMVTDLGDYYSGYAGENPWGDVNFLSGNAGTIKEKMLREWRTDFLQGQPINSCTDICVAYSSCFGCSDNGPYNTCIASCTDIQNNETGCGVPFFDCTISVNERNEAKMIRFYPNPAQGELHILFPSEQVNAKVLLISSSGQVVRSFTCSTSKSNLDLRGIAKGTYSLKIENTKFVLAEEQVIIE